MTQTLTAIETPRVPLVRRRSGWARDALRRRLLAVADLLAVVVLALAFPYFAGGAVVGVCVAALAPLWLVLAKLHGLYDRDHRVLRHVTVDDVPQLFLWSLTGLAAVLLLVEAVHGKQPTAAADAAGLLVVVAAAVAFRAAARLAWRRLVPPQRTLLLGGGAAASAARRKLDLFDDIHAVVVAQRDDALLHDDGDWDWLDGLDLDRILVVAPSIDETLVERLLHFCRRRQIRLSLVPPARSRFGTAVTLEHVAELPVVVYNTWEVSRSTLLLKRAVDVAGAALLLVLFAPLLLAVSLAILLEGGRPVLFRQCRAGRNGQPFSMLKFRTMVADAEERLPEVVCFDELAEPMFKLRGDPRVTRLGRLVRRFSIDELPQLLNVLRGEMSLVGPRPEQLELVERYGEDDRVRLQVKPGLTGPMQVYGRGELSFGERVALERDYVENLSLRRDVRLLGYTIPAVLLGRGAF